MKSLIVMSLCAASALSAQASYTTYGLGCGAHWGEPPTRARIAFTGLPRIGHSVQVSYVGPHFSSRPYSRIPILVSGTSRTNYAGLSLPYLIPEWFIGGGSTDCHVLCSIEAIEGVFSSYLQIDIPANPSLVGLKIYQQWHTTYILRGPTVEVFTVLSDGAEMTIGR